MIILFNDLSGWNRQLLFFYLGYPFCKTSNIIWRGASAVSDGYSKTWHVIFMIAVNGHFSEAKSANIQFIGCIFPLRNDFVRNSGCSHLKWTPQREHSQFLTESSKQQKTVGQNEYFDWIGRCLAPFLLKNAPRKQIKPICQKMRMLPTQQPALK